MTSIVTKCDVCHIEIHHKCQDSHGSAVVRNVKGNECIENIFKKIAGIALSRGGCCGKILTQVSSITLLGI